VLDANANVHVVGFSALSCAISAMLRGAPPMGLIPNIKALIGEIKAARRGLEDRDQCRAA